jgi:hypothetical protein
MLSVVVYGRNDAHGYNLHKRAAISLNCVAHLLTDVNDEILFVDYNTPDDLPTFVEAIADTLTEEAKRRIRILRVRPVHHGRFADRTRLPALEPIARNVAVRRSNPSNRWILSTNTDMIFMPRRARSLSDVARDLDDGFYHLPRFEVPEAMWEAFDRRNASAIIDQLGDWGRRFHINEIVYGSPEILYDAPGDMQLMLRKDLFEIHGFDEEMILGWHVDSNIARRLRIHRGAVKSALDGLLGYHCDHTRQHTAFHSSDRTQNDLDRFVDGVTVAALQRQSETWGLAGEEIEEFSLGDGASARYLRSLESVLPPGDAAFYEATYTGETYNSLDYEPRHVLPHLLNLLCCVDPGARIAYAGTRQDTYDLLSRGWAALSARGGLAVPNRFDWLTGSPNGRPLDAQQWLENADIYIFEVGRSPALAQMQSESRNAAVLRLFHELVQLERRRMSVGLTPRLIIAVNAIHNEFEGIVIDTLSFSVTPFSSRIRHGYVTSQATAPGVTPATVGTPRPGSSQRADAGQFGSQLHRLRLADGIIRTPFGLQVRARTANAGTFATLDIERPDPGDYELVIEIGKTSTAMMADAQPALAISGRLGGRSIVEQSLPLPELAHARHRVPFRIPPRQTLDSADMLEIRLDHFSRCDIDVVNVALW